MSFLLSGGDPENKFLLGAMTGQLSCKPLDREENSLYNLTIKAEDNGPKPQLYSLTTVLITVLDLNDNDPQFIGTPYASSIPENTLPETSVLTVQATDDDEGVNSLISYSINNSAQGLFKIDNATGLITTAGYVYLLVSFIKHS
jgi:protocadherin-16/23